MLFEITVQDWRETMNRILHYQLSLDVLRHDEKLKGRSIIQIEGESEDSTLFFLLYHELKVLEIRLKQGALLSFEQEIKTVQTNYQVNEIKVFLPQGDIDELEIKYEGTISGYESIFPYIKDSLSPEFSILRNDCLVYPILAKANEESIRLGILNEFHYDIYVTVPMPYVVASGGRFIGVEKTPQFQTYHYKSHRKMWRIDICVAKYQIIETESIRLFVFEEDVKRTYEKVILELNRVFELFEQRFGCCERVVPFSIIEIKEGFGSQAGEDYLLMEEHGFKEGEYDHTHLYHEIGHGWNPRVNHEMRKTRFFDEAFASYFEAIAIKKFYGITRYEEKMESYRQSFLQRVQYDRLNLEPICDYGQYNISYNSYTKGPFVLAALESLMGEATFNRFIQLLIQTSKKHPIDFNDFQKLAENVLSYDLSTFMNDWIYEKEALDALIKRYFDGEGQR